MNGFPCVTDPPWNALCDDSTNDTTAVQTAINDVSAIGASRRQKIPLCFPPERACVLSSVIPRSYVDIQGCGIMLKRDPAYGADHALFYASQPSGIGGPITQFAIRDVGMIGTGAETQNQGLLTVDRSISIKVKECSIADVAAAIIDLADCQDVWVDDNDITDCGHTGGHNIIHFQNGGNGNTIPLKNLWTRGNKILGTCPVLGIAVISSNTANRTDPVVDAHITDNTVNHTGGGWPIAIEQGGAGTPPNVSTFDISGNTVYQNGTNSNPYGIALTNDSRPNSTDPLCISDVTMTGNRIHARVPGGIGIGCMASHATITGNQIWADTDDVRVITHGTPSAVLTNITIVGNGGGRGTGVPVALFGGSNPVDPTTFVAYGNARVGPVTVPVPKPGVPVGYKGYNRIFYVIAPPVSPTTMTRQDGLTIVVPPSRMAAVRVPAGQTVTPTGGTPAWIVEGE